MSDVQTADTQPEALSPADFAMPDEGEIRLPPNNPNLRQPAQAQEQDAPAGDEQPEDEPEEQPAEDDPYAEAPEFWSKERKAAYAKITDPEVRQAIHEQESESRAAVSKKIEEAALEKKSAAEKLVEYERQHEQLANWWKDTGPKLASAFRSKWEGINWQEMAENNPAEYVRLQEAYKNDATLIQQAARQNEQAQAAAARRSENALRESKRVEHEKLAKALPEAFGKPDVAQKTYDDLAEYLAKQGVPGDRIPNIYESFVVSVAYKAMLYDKAQAARASATTQQQPTTATQTPRRIAPGATQRSGQPKSSEAYRQARERLNNGGSLSPDDAALLFA